MAFLEFLDEFVLMLFRRRVAGWGWGDIYFGEEVVPEAVWEFGEGGFLRNGLKGFLELVCAVFREPVDV